jgi:hypothetical protein
MPPDPRFRAIRDLSTMYNENIRLNNENMAEYSRNIRELIQLISDSSALDILHILTQPTSPTTLTMSQIDNATRNVQYDSDIMNQTQCPITLEEFTESELVCQIRECRHMFRRVNLMRWFDTHTCCPVCRYDLRQYGEPVTVPVPEPAPAPTPTPSTTPITTTTDIARVLARYVSDQITDASGNMDSIYTFRFPINIRPPNNS